MPAISSRGAVALFLFSHTLRKIFVPFFLVYFFVRFCPFTRPPYSKNQLKSRTSGSSAPLKNSPTFPPFFLRLPFFSLDCLNFAFFHLHFFLDAGSSSSHFLFFPRANETFARGRTQVSRTSAITSILSHPLPMKDYRPLFPPVSVGTLSEVSLS